MTDDVSPAALLDVSVEAGPTTIIALAGDLDPATAPALEDALGPVLADATVERVVLDLSALAFLDSSGLRVFVTARDALAARQATLTLRQPTTNTRRLLQITGLDEIIDVE